MIYDGHAEARHLSALTIEVGKFIESTNFDAGVSGWRIDGDGNVEMNDGLFRGDLTSDSLQVGSGLLIDQNTVSGRVWMISSDEIRVSGEPVVLQSLSGDVNLVAADQIDLDAANGVRVNLPGVGLRELEVEGINTAGGGFRNVRVAN